MSDASCLIDRIVTQGKVGVVQAACLGWKAPGRVAQLHDRLSQVHGMIEESLCVRVVRMEDRTFTNPQLHGRCAQLGPAASSGVIRCLSSRGCGVPGNLMGTPSPGGAGRRELGTFMSFRMMRRIQRIRRGLVWRMSHCSTWALASPSALTSSSSFWFSPPTFSSLSPSLSSCLPQFGMNRYCRAAMCVLMGRSTGVRLNPDSQQEFLVFAHAA